MRTRLVLLAALVVFLITTILTIARSRRVLTFSNAYHYASSAAPRLPPVSEESLAPTASSSVAPTLAPVVHINELGLGLGLIDPASNGSFSRSSTTGLTTPQVEEAAPKACTVPTRVLYIPHERATRGITDRITRILALVGVSAVTKSVIHLHRPRLFIGTKHSRRIPRRGATAWWDGYLNLTALNAKVEQSTGWKPCGGVIQKVDLHLNYSALFTADTDCLRRWSIDNAVPSVAASTAEESVEEICGVPDLDDFSGWFRPIVRGQFLWYSRTRSLFRAAHAGAYPMSARLMDAAYSAAKSLGWPETQFIALKLRLSDKAKYVKETDCVATQRIAATVQTALANSTDASLQSTSIPLLLMSDETNETYLQDLRVKLSQIPSISVVRMEGEFPDLNRIRVEARDEPGSFLAALFMHRLAALRFVTFERERYAGEEGIPHDEGILQARAAEVLCPGVVNHFRRWHRPKTKKRRKHRKKHTETSVT